MNLLDISDGNSQDNYLGLPTMVGRNKRRIFNDIKERVGNKLRSWKSNMFSFGGKEILLKAVAQTIPTYSMSIFKLPLSLCGDLSDMMSKFLWGSRDRKRKISWTSWDSLCFLKSHGSLGFKDISLFNQALLAKQAWRIIHSPASLVARVFKAKYFNNVDLLSTTIKNGCSPIWRRLIWGRKLLSKGLRWCRRDWNIDKLNQFLLPVDRTTVLTIPISWSGDRDFLRWHFDKTREYMAAQIKVEDFGLVCMIVWAIWESHNSFLNCGRIRDSSLVVSRGEDLLYKFRIFSQVTVSSPPCSVCSLSSVWLAPSPGLLKLNIGFASRRNYVFFGVGVAIRDNTGKVLVAWSNLAIGSFSADIGHPVALREGLLLAKFYKLPISSVELSSRFVEAFVAGSPFFVRGCLFYR
ncbi:hypothetical protein Ddye_004768 [Dipteronia dyeriana]|uniref:Reverse transcriptase n=1 Tax=Dipteronia dyeriana TaxID=168575 RepID=A0AAD9XFA2_9ROSI|nr:hypothetical protein Ddye_004768 [Dipteronia dyeriana]